MLVRRVTVGVVAAVLSATLLVGPAVASDAEFGSLTCAVGKVVWITERTSAGTTTVTWNGGSRKLLKQQWSTTTTRARVAGGPAAHRASGAARCPERIPPGITSAVVRCAG
jgi:hypothetical protein